jgi:predicted DsbA family dithiol-disulfide isomerase
MLDPNGDYLRRVWASSVYPMAERLGMPIKLPSVQPRSRPAHEAAHWAGEQGRFEDYNAAVFRAFFERGEDIGQIDVLTSLASGLALDSVSLREALVSRRFERTVLDDERDAERLGITGVPAFVADRKAAASGVQTVQALKQLVEHVRA